MPGSDDVDTRPSYERGRVPDRRLLLAAVGAAALVVVLLAVAMSRPGEAPSTLASGRSTTSAPSTTTTTVSPTTTTVAPTTTTTAPPPPPTEPPTTAPPPPPTEPLDEAAPPSAPAPALADAAATGAYCLGDSVMLGTSSAYFGTLTLCGEVDAVVGRQASAGAGILQAHGPFPNTVVIHLGTNGPTDAGELDAMLEVVASVPRVVLVNVQLNGTRSWEGSVNAEVAAAVGRWPNVRLADWYAASAGHPDWFRADGIHPTATGAEVYAATIAEAAAAP